MAKNEPHYLLNNRGDRLQPVDIFAFFDWGTISRVKRLGDELKGRILLLKGADLRLQIRQNLRFAVKYGAQLKEG